MGTILIQKGRIWDGEGFFYADVLTKNGIIARIGENIEPEKDTFVFDATGMTVSAGLVDCHIHMAGLEPDRYGISADMSTIPFGVTAAADAGGAHANRELVENHLVKSVTFVQVDIRDNRAVFPVTRAKLQVYGENAIGIKVYFDSHKPDVRDIAPLREACAFARKQGLRVMVHCSNSPVAMAEFLPLLSPGDILTHPYHGGIHSAAEDDFAALKEAKERGVIIDAGFAGHIHTDLGIFRAAVEQGILPDTVSTDITCASAYKRGGRFGLTMCMSMARTAGMAEEAIFRAVTSAPAKALGKDADWGYLREGRCADIAVLSYENEPFSLTDKAGNTLEDTKGYRCKLTVANGEVVWRD